MEEILPWKVLLGVVRRHYPKRGSGRPPIGLEPMLRIYFMQQWYGLSDPAMEDSLYDITAMRRFAGLSFNEIPDETTILRFRHMLERHNVTEKLFRKTEQYLSERNLILSEGTIVDATIIAAPSSTKNQDKQRDPEMKQTCRNTHMCKPCARQARVCRSRCRDRSGGERYARNEPASFRASPAKRNRI